MVLIALAALVAVVGSVFSLDGDLPPRLGLLIAAVVVGVFVVALSREPEAARPAEGTGELGGVEPNAIQSPDAER